MSNTPLRLSSLDVQLILKALALYDKHVELLNEGIFPISEDDLSDLNNDCEYMKGLIRMLEQYATVERESARKAD